MEEKGIPQNKYQVANLIFTGGDRNYDETVKVLDCLNINTPFSDEILLNEKNIQSVKYILGMKWNQENKLTLNRAINWTISFAIRKKGIEIPDNILELKKLNKEVIYTEKRQGYYVLTYENQDLLELEEVNGDITAAVL